MQALRVELAKLDLVWKKVIPIPDRPKAIRNLRRNGNLLRMRLNIDARGLGARCIYLRRAGHSGLSCSDFCRTQRTLPQPTISRTCEGVRLDVRQATKNQALPKRPVADSRSPSS